MKLIMSPGFMNDPVRMRAFYFPQHATNGDFMRTYIRLCDKVKICYLCANKYTVVPSQTEGRVLFEYPHLGTHDTEMACPRCTVAPVAKPVTTHIRSVSDKPMTIKQIEKAAEKARKEAEKEAEKAAKQLEKEAEKARKEAEKTRKQLEKEIEKQQKAAEKAAQKAAQKK